MAVILSCVNLKGGVGKTAIAVNFAAYCGRRGKRTLLVDLDPQTNATFSCLTVDQWQEHSANYGTVADLFGVKSHTSAEGKVKEAKDVIKSEVFQNVDLIPSHVDLFTIDLDIAGATARETKLARALEPVAKDYDVIVCDCPPNLTIPTQNALALSSHYVVPISPDFLSSLGVALLLRRVSNLATELRHPIQHAGIVISRVGRPSQFRAETVAALRQTFRKEVLLNEIKERSSVAQAASQQKSIYDMGDAAASEEFIAMSSELMKKIGLTK